MLTQLREIVEKVAAAPSLLDALEQLVISTCKAMKTECCSVYIADHQRQRFTLMATKGLKKPHRHVGLPFGQGLVGLVADRAEPINVADARHHPHFKHLPGIGEESFSSFFGTPIIHQRQVLGVLVIQQREQREFDESEESFMVTLAAQLAVLLAHAKAQGMWPDQHNGLHLVGSAASTGVAVARAWWDDNQPRLELVAPASCLDRDAEQERLSIAIELASAEFRRLRKRFDSELHKETLAIFDLFSHLLNDPMLRKDLSHKIAGGDLAEWAIRQVVETYSARFSNMEDAYLKERAHDIRELGQRLLYFLANEKATDHSWEEPVVLLTRELTAAMLASVPRDKLAAVVSQEGAANSHAAILSRALGIPAVMGVDFVPEKIHNCQVIVDGYRGDLLVNPNRHVLAEYLRLQKEEQELAEVVETGLDKPAATLDDERINIFLNAGLSADTSIAVNRGVDGVGLYRTEVPFLLQRSFPSEEEQTQQYQSILKTYGGKPVVMRTLDIGGDKPLPYLAIEEDNPFLGWRGIRFTLDHPEIFLIQVRAMLKASIGHDNMDILLPMISGIAELDESLVLIERAYTEVAKTAAEQGYALRRPRIGIMIEVPSILYQLPVLKGRVDYISVGSNDLTQYLLAVDRNNSRVAGVYDALHPAVIHALKHIIDVSQQLELPVSVCGELAGDPIGALLLVGMGYRSLSMNTRNVAKIKYMLRHVSVSDMEQLADFALSAIYADEVRRNTIEFVDGHGLGGFIRAGK
ncbi:phosphoenolpyruvate--protein phosphotransferase [Photobacterium lutimaris]|uniref:phosphoenolpyruvate--protein phosphotransferase n=1 Tax=Photobacterium lutimaris TaxID=388278 RepID=A0A2T3IU49_9GAMM|nr:phosphoenolpyruvate--protein phosphotransferase [Photobacterium lutimaris]PSU31899.1 phosphoenolpyruvate-protein phosphotransferase PtsP [Photobacterium lutimaris]TDR73427.1 phosphotransferase system enzyme I (PtsP) [Photobacterium lutimaris]